MSVTFTLMPAAIAPVIAGSPAAVAGILIITFSRATAACRRFAAASVPAESWARRGLTSMLTRPSMPFEPSYTARMRSHAIWMSSIASASNSASPSSPFAIAAASAPS